MNADWYEVVVPGSWRAGVTCLDLETSKVPAPTGFRMANGEVLKRRWSVVMAGVARDGVIHLVRDLGTEVERLVLLGQFLRGSGEVRYAATREFDEMICRGRFTNARRAHEPRPYFPAVPGADYLPWRNVRGAEVPAERGADVPSREISATLARGGHEVVTVHLLRDVAELILTADPDATCRAWCLRVLADYDFAKGVIYGD